MVLQPAHLAMLALFAALAVLRLVVAVVGGASPTGRLLLSFFHPAVREAHAAGRKPADWAVVGAIQAVYRLLLFLALLLTIAVFSLQRLVTEYSTAVVVVLVVVLSLMRLTMWLAPAGTPAARFVLWFWHPDARGTAPPSDDPRPLHQLTVQNMDGTLVAFGLVFLVIRPFVIQAFYIPSSSMEPTLMGNPAQKDRVLVSKYLYHLRPPQRGEIAVFHAPEAATQGRGGPRQDYIKRIVGVPGDSFEVRAHRVFVNGEPLPEPYLSEQKLREFALYDSGPGSGGPAYFGPVEIPPGHYIMMGDNRNNSHDARSWGEYDSSGQFVHQPFITKADMLGKAVCVFWPPRAVRLLH